DIQMLLKVLHDFVDAGNTVLVVEHNLDVIKTADWIIDLGPDGGAGGGEIVAVGTPEEIAASSVKPRPAVASNAAKVSQPLATHHSPLTTTFRSYTGESLQKVLHPEAAEQANAAAAKARAK